MFDNMYLIELVFKYVSSIKCFYAKQIGVYAKKHSAQLNFSYENYMVYNYLNIIDDLCFAIMGNRNYCVEFRIQLCIALDSSTSQMHFEVGYNRVSIDKYLNA